MLEKRFERSLALIAKRLKNSAAIALPWRLLLAAAHTLRFKRSRRTRRRCLVKSNAGWPSARQKAARGRDAQATGAARDHRQYAGRLKENILDMENRRQWP